MPSACAHTAEVRDRNTGHAVDRIEAVKFERVDDQMKTICQLLLRIIRSRRL